MQNGFRRLLLTACLFILPLVGCDQLSSHERDIKKYTRAIETAKNDLKRAQAYDGRGRAYAEKARYSHFRKLIPSEDYAMMFALAIDDHNKAIELAPRNAELFFGRGKSYYFRAAYVEMPLGASEIPAGSNAPEYFNRALADFRRATELDPGHYFAFDMKGLIGLAIKDYDQAIVDFTQAMNIDPVHGKPRLSDAYCLRGSSFLQQQRYDDAIADYQKSMALYSQADGCSCEPFNPLAGIYAAQGEMNKGWEIVRRAGSAGVGIGSDIMEKLGPQNK